MPSRNVWQPQHNGDDGLPWLSDSAHGHIWPACIAACIAVHSLTHSLTPSLQKGGRNFQDVQCRPLNMYELVTKVYSGSPEIWNISAVTSLIFAQSQLILLASYPRILLMTLHLPSQFLAKVTVHGMSQTLHMGHATYCWCVLYKTTPTTGLG